MVLTFSKVIVRELHLEDFKTYRFPGPWPRGSESVCLGRAAELLLDKHLLVSLRDASLEVALRSGVEGTGVCCGCQWVCMCSQHLLVHLGGADYMR